MNKKILYGLVGAILVVCLAIGTGAAFAQTEPAQTIAAYNKENILTVNGSGKVSIKPDVAYIQLGVRTLNQDAKKAQEENKTIMNKVLPKLKSLGIEEKDIQTSSYNIHPRYNYQNNKETLEGYEVENMLRVTVRKIDKVGDILDAVAKEGVNRTYGISFGILDMDAAYKQALQKAIDDAKGKADVMAKQASVTLKKPVAIYEGSAPQSIYQYQRDFGVSYDMAEKANLAAAAGVPIASGELEVQANVTIVYQMQ